MTQQSDRFFGPFGRARSLRHRLFRSHLVVMAVALIVLVLVFGLFEMFGVGREIGGRRSGADRPGSMLLGLSAAAIASAIVSWGMTRSLTRPMDELGEATRQLAAGRYGVRVPGADTLELDELAADVNQLAEQLETTEKRRLRLIGDVAHELRNPLSTIEGTMEALIDGVLNADDDTFTRIGREAARLRRLSYDLSSLSAAAELGTLDSEVIDMKTLVSSIAAQLEPQAAAKGLRLTLEVGSVVDVLGDRDRLTQVLMNVVGNAVQYTDSGEVLIRLTTDGISLVIEVADSGRGLAGEDLLLIFDRFHRVDQQFTDGTGVGLAIAKSIVESHGGDITAASPGLELGTTVRIEIPGVSQSHLPY